MGRQGHLAAQAGECLGQLAADGPGPQYQQAPRRFDTRFFIAAMPDNQETIAHVWETADDEWVRPRDALAAWEAGRWQMISPTLTTLTSIAGYSDVPSMLAAVLEEAHLEPLTDELRQQGMHDLR